MEKKDKHTGGIRGFSRCSKAWYNIKLHNNAPLVQFGIYHFKASGESDGTTGEMSMRWVDLGEGEWSALLECAHDAFNALQTFPDVLERLADLPDSRLLSEEGFCKILVDCGFKDLSCYERPADHNDAALILKVTLQGLLEAREFTSDRYEKAIASLCQKEPVSQ